MERNGQVVGEILEQVCVMTLQVPNTEYKLCFSKSLMNQSPTQYLRRFARFGYPMMVAAMIYIDRLVHKGIPVTPLSIYRLIAGCYRLALKFWNDEQLCSPHTFARIAGLTTQDLNRLERHLLPWIGYQLDITPATYQEYTDLIKNFSICTGKN